MRRALLTLLLLQLALAAPASAAPDQWTRWAVPQNLGISATVRSLDFTAPGVVYAGTEDDGVFRSIGGPFAWEQDNDGLGAPGADNIRHVVSRNGILYAATSVGIFKKPANGPTGAPHGWSPRSPSGTARNWRASCRCWRGRHGTVPAARTRIRSWTPPG